MIDIVAFFNQPIPGHPDPQVTRVFIVLFVMAVAFGWTKNMFHHWPEWAREVKRITQWITALLVANGIGLVAAAQRDDPIRVETLILGLTFVGLSAAIFLRLHDDDSTAPVYPNLYPSALWARLRGL